MPPPEPIQGRPLFRPEAINHRRWRHLGDIALLRPLSLRLVTLCPLLIAALLVFALSRLDFQAMFVALVEEAPAPGRGLQLSLETRVAEHLRRGDEIELRFVGSAERSSGVISDLSTTPCSREARAFLQASLRPAEEACLQITFTPHRSLSSLPAPLPLKAQVWAPPRSYLTHLLHR
jgi:hypothetical protein